MIQEIIIIFGVIYIIFWLFYKDSVAEFRINQVEWAKRGNVTSLLSEKVPIVIRGVPKISIWTHDDVIHRDIYNNIPIFKNKNLSNWVSEIKEQENLECPWDIQHARILGDRSAFKTWIDKWLIDWIVRFPWKWAWNTNPSCWTGARSMFRTIAPWTVIAPTEGEMMISIFPSKEFDYALPTNWRELWIPHITNYDTPFAGELKFMDICLRPGHILLLPAHWYASWEESGIDAEERQSMGIGVPLMSVVMEFHTLFSMVEDWRELKFGSKWREKRDDKERRRHRSAIQTEQREKYVELPSIQSPSFFHEANYGKLRELQRTTDSTATEPAPRNSQNYANTPSETQNSSQDGFNTSANLQSQPSNPNGYFSQPIGDSPKYKDGGYRSFTEPDTDPREQGEPRRDEHSYGVSADIKQYREFSDTYSE